jgi:hypothetical protein
MIVHAGNEGVAAFDTMNKTVVAQKFERAINRDWRRTRLLLQAVNDFIGAKWAVAAQQNFEHLAPHRGEPLRARGALRFGMGNRGAGAALMVVVGRGKNCGRHDGLVLCPASARRSPYALVCAVRFCTSLMGRRSFEKSVSGEACNLILHCSKKLPTFLGKLYPIGPRCLTWTPTFIGGPPCCRENQRW